MSISVHIWVDLHFKTENGSIDQTWENKEGHFVLKVSLVLIYGLFDQVMTILRFLEVVRHVTK